MRKREIVEREQCGWCATRQLSKLTYLAHTLANPLTVQEEYKKNQKLIRFDPEILESGVYKKTIVRPGQSEPTDPRAIAGVEGEDENGAGQNFRDAKMEQAAAAMKAASEALANGDDPTLAAERAALEWERKNSGGATGAADKVRRYETRLMCIFAYDVLRQSNLNHTAQHYHRRPARKRESIIRSPSEELTRMIRRPI